MKIIKIAIIAACSIGSTLGMAQDVLDPIANFHAGVHSGSWTLKRSQLLEEESKDLYRSCPDPYCARCAKHLANYGHEYQYLGGPHQRQPWYRGTIGSIAIVTQRGYDQHGRPYAVRGQPAVVVPWEYMQTLNHAIWEQVNARNAVAAEEAAHDRIVLLTKLLTDAKEQLRLSKEAWEQIEPQGKSCGKVPVADMIVAPCSKTYTQFSIDMQAGHYEVARRGMCAYCLAYAQYQFDMTYVADVERELALAGQIWKQKSAEATEAVRIALLSKEDADKATRISRLQYKPPKYKEVLAAIGESANNTEQSAKQATE